MGMSDYYKNVREKIGNDLIFMPCVVGMIRNQKDEILFGRKHNEENWGLIAGAIEIGENPAEAVIREVKEETGLDVIPEQILGVYGGKDRRFTYSNGHQVEYLSIVFDCKVIGGELIPKNDEMCELEYFSETDLPPILNKYPSHIFERKQGDRTDFEK